MATGNSYSRITDPYDTGRQVTSRTAVIEHLDGDTIFFQSDGTCLQENMVQYP